MTITRSQMYRQLYQMGGQGIMQLENGQEEPIFPRLETLSQNLGQAEQTLGSPSNDQFNMSSITTAITGRPQMNIGGRIGYQEGNMAMAQPEGIMGAMPPEAGGMMQEGGQEQTALLTIIQLLIEQGVPPEQAQELAMQILQVFAQGGAPAVEEFANQLEQEEGMSEDRTMMAGGGITNLYPRQGFFVKGVVKSIGKAVKGVANAVKSVAKSPIGQIALAIAAPYAIGALVPGFAALGGTGFMGAALRAGISNLAIQGITTGKFNPKQALIAAIGGGVAQGVFGPAGGASTDIGQGTLNAGGAGIPGADIAGSSTLTSGVTSSLPTSSFAELTGQVAPNSMVYNPPTNAASIYTDLAGQVDPTSSVVNVGTPQPNFFDKTTASIKDFGTNLMNDPMKTIKTGIGSIYDTATQTIKDNPYTAVGTSFLAGTQFRAPLAGEDPNEYNKLKAEHDAQVSQYYNLYSGYMNPPAFAANGGRIGFEYGSMPMGEPRKNPAGIMELDYRQKGGFVPPIGIKEKADDIPAMLSNNEFVFTANAVRNAGGGDVDRGAQRMYSLMKNLESGGRV
jgi:hypothetical protein